MELASAAVGTWLLLGGSAVKGTAVGGGGGSEVGSMEGRERRFEEGEIDL